MAYVPVVSKSTPVGKSLGGGTFSGSLSQNVAKGNITADSVSKRAIQTGAYSNDDLIQGTKGQYPTIQPNMSLLDGGVAVGEGKTITKIEQVNQPSPEVTKQIMAKTKGSDIAKFYATSGREGLPFQFDKSMSQPIYNEKGEKVGYKTGTIGYNGREYTSYTLEPTKSDLRNQSESFKESLSSNTKIIRGGSSLIYTQPKSTLNPAESVSPPQSAGLNFTPASPYGYTGLKGETVIYNYEQQKSDYYSTPMAQYLYSRNAKAPAFIASLAESTIYGTKEFTTKTFKGNLKAISPKSEYFGLKFNNKVYGINLEGASVKQGIIGTSIIVAQFTPLALPVDLYFVGKGLKDIYSGVKEKSGQKITEGTLQSLSIFGIKQGLKPIKNIYVRAGSEFVPPEQVFAESVLSGKEPLPTVKSISQSLELFNKPINGEIKVISASPSKISGNIAGESRKSLLGLEDSGIYVSSYGRGSPEFLRVIDKNTNIEIGSGSILSDINPKNLFSLPTTSVFKVKSVSLQPREVVLIPGFSATKQFFEEIGSKTGMAYITKRSELGTGNLISQKYIIPKGTSTFRFTAKFNGKVQTKTFREGDIIKEFGTPEQEAVIPYKTKFRLTSTSIKGFSQYTTYKGYNIPIREYELIQTQKEFKTSNIFSKEAKFKTTKQLSDLQDHSYLKRQSSTSRILSNISKTSNLYNKSLISKVSNTSSIYSNKSNISSTKSTISKITSSTSKVSYPTKSTISKITSSTTLNPPNIPPNKRKIKFDKQQKKQSFKISSKSIYQPKKYTPTVTSIAYNIKGKESKFATSSGFSGRPI